MLNTLHSPWWVRIQFVAGSRKMTGEVSILSGDDFCTLSSPNCFRCLCTTEQWRIKMSTSQAWHNWRHSSSALSSYLHVCESSWIDTLQLIAVLFSLYVLFDRNLQMFRNGIFFFSETVQTSSSRFFFFTPFTPFSLSLLIFIFAFYRVLFINSLDISVKSEDAFLFYEHIVWLKFYRPQGKIIVAS